MTGYSLRWIRVIANRYNQKGAAGVGDGRQHNCGAEPLLDEVQQAQVLQAISPIIPFLQPLSILQYFAFSPIASH